MIHIEASTRPSKIQSFGTASKKPYSSIVVIPYKIRSFPDRTMIECQDVHELFCVSGDLTEFISMLTPMKNSEMRNNIRRKSICSAKIY